MSATEKAVAESPAPSDRPVPAEEPVPAVSLKVPVQQHRCSPWPARVWPVVRHAAAPRHALFGALLAGVVGSVVLSGTGIGYPITVVAILAAVACVRPERTTTWHAAGALTVLALSSVAVFRSAGWLVTMSMWLAVFVAGAVLSGSWTWRGTALGAMTPVLVMYRTVRWTSHGIRRLDTGRVHFGRVAAVAVVTIVVVGVFAALFAGADPAFGRLVDEVAPEWDPDVAAARVMVFLLVAGGVLAASYVVVNRPRFDRLARPSSRSIRLWEWGVPLAALVAVFAGFVGVQIGSLFGGQSHVLVSDGLTNAEYARQGFWQLLAVTALTLLVIAIVIGKASRASVVDRAALRILLGLLCTLSLVVVASALHRMSLYEQQYGYTTLRLFVTAVELWLGSVFLLVMATGLKMSGRWLPRAVGAGAVLTVLGLAVLNPDAYIARHNVERFETTGKIDTRYLSRLSSDAAPELDRLPEPYRSCALGAGEPSGSWRDWNVSDARASELLEQRPTATCAAMP